MLCFLRGVCLFMNEECVLSTRKKRAIIFSVLYLGAVEECVSSFEWTVFYLGEVCYFY